MKGLVNMVLIIAVLVQTCAASLIYAGFKVNREYIAANLCENRSKPMLHCNGKCVLKKQLEGNQKKEEKSATLKGEGAVTGMPVIVARFLFNSNSSCSVKPVLVSSYVEPLHATVYQSIFHPPGV